MGLLYSKLKLHSVNYTLNTVMSFQPDSYIYQALRRFVFNIYLYRLVTASKIIKPYPNIFFKVLIKLVGVMA